MFAKYRSSSRTVTLMWCGFTQRVGCEQIGDFSKRSPSVDSNGMALNRITITRSSRQTLSACLKQSMRRILPFWSGLLKMHWICFLPVIPSTNSSRNSCDISLRNFPSNLEAHFCLASKPSHWSSFLQLRSSQRLIRLSFFLKYFLFAACKLNQLYAKALTWGSKASINGWKSSCLQFK